VKLIKWLLSSFLFFVVCIALFGYIYLYVMPKGPDRTETRVIPAGKDSFVINAYRHTDRKTIRVWTYKPEEWTQDKPILFVMHGMGRNAESYLDAWSDIADQKGLMLVAPEFESKFYKVITNDYQEGNVKSYFGWSNPEEEWAFTVVENIFDYIKSANGLSISSYDIFGHSAGGQFVQRMIALKPDARIRTAIAANAGSYAFMDNSVRYPYGLASIKHNVEKSFAKHLVILLGELDNNAQQGKLDQTEAAMNQGSDRLERGRNFFLSSKASAKKRGTEFSWSLQVVPNVGHNYKKMSEVAATLL
jgi:pimeloyl-ACP methyl ester carboxylesterase